VYPQVISDEYYERILKRNTTEALKRKTICFITAQCLHNNPRT